MTKPMTVSQVMESRFTCRAFLNEPIPEAVIRDILTRAIRAPSGGNLQPQHLWVLTGDDLQALIAKVGARIAAGDIADGPMEYVLFPQDLKEPYLSRRIGIGAQMYGALEVARDDARARGDWFAKNMEFFGAPVGIFVALDRQMNHPQWSDLGMFVMAVMLLAREHDLQASALEAWALFPRMVAEHVNMPPELMLFCGVALGKPDMTHPVNQFRAARAPLDEIAVFRGF
jgi:nitroreductase